MDNVKVWEWLVTTLIKRKSRKALIEAVRQSDFYNAPATSVDTSELAKEGKLLESTLWTFVRLLQMTQTKAAIEAKEFSLESAAIVSLLYNLGRINSYEKYKRNVKNPDTGDWEELTFWKYNSENLLPNGEQACSFIMKYMGLTDEEYVAIRFYDGGASETYRSMFTKAIQVNKLAWLLHAANMEAVWFYDTELVSKDLEVELKAIFKEYGIKGEKASKDAKAKTEKNVKAEAKKEENTETKDEADANSNVEEKLKNSKELKEKYGIDKFISKKFFEPRLTKGRGEKKPSPIEDLINDAGKVRYVALKGTWDASEIYIELFNELGVDFEDKKAFEEVFGC